MSVQWECFHAALALQIFCAFVTVRPPALANPEGGGCPGVWSRRKKAHTHTQRKDAKTLSICAATPSESLQPDACKACRPPGKCQLFLRAWDLTAQPGRGRNSVACSALWKAPRTARRWTLMRSRRAGARVTDESLTDRPTSPSRGRWR